MKKLFTLLTLLVAIVTGAQAQDPDISFVLESSTYANYFKTYTIGGQNVVVGSSASSISSGNGGYYIDLGSTGTGFGANYINIKAPTTAKIAKISVYATGSGNSKAIKAPVFGFAEGWDNSSTNADNIDYIEFTSASSNGGKFNTAEWYDVDVSNWDASEVRVYRSIKGITVTGESITTGETVGGGQTLRVWGLKVWLKASAPSITTHPKSATYADGDPISALTVTATASAGDLSYQWYKCDDANKTNAAAIDGATSDSYTPTVEGFYYVNVKDDNGNVDSNVAHVEIEAASTPTISIAAGGSTEVTAGATITLTATAAGVPGPTIQWYVSDTNDTSAGTAISGATNATYTFDAVAGTKYYYATASNKVQSNVASNVVTVIAAARTGYTLNQVVFSNSFDAFITAPAAAVYFTQKEIDEAQVGDAAYGKTTEDIKTPAVAASIKAYYMQGETAPIVSSVNMSPGATYVVEGNTLTVTSEDGQTSVAYPITLSAVTPYDGTGKRTFDGTETWVKTGNAFSTDSKKQGWIFSKNDSDWSRETPGKNRIYFFLAPTATVTFENGGTERNIKVYKNGTLLSTPTSTSSCTIAGDTENNFMIAIVSNQTSGDGAIKSITTPVPTLTLDDTSNGNATKIAALNGKTANVTVERNLSTQYYNTLFLPFAMTAEQMTAAFGEGAQVATFVKMNSATEFGFGNVTAMEANVPYLVKPAQEVNGFTVEGVTINNTAAAGVVDGGYSMVGTYDTFTNGSSTSGSSIGGGISIGGGSSSTPDEIYYFATTGKIKKLTSTGSIKGLRAFMVKLPAGKTSVETIVSNAGIKFGGAGGGSARARQDFVLYLDDDNTTTGIEAIENGQLTIDNDAPAYNLAGQKVGKGYKGIVIINGKKVVK